MANKENTFIGVFDSQEEVLNKVAELKSQGHNESDMYVVGRDHNSFSTVQNETSVHVDATTEKKSHGFMGKVMAALSDDASLAAFKGMRLERYEAKEYAEQVRNGKLVLYADSDYGNTYDRYGTGYSNSSGIEQTSPLETGVTFASSSSSGSTADTDSTGDGSSSNNINSFGTTDSAGGQNTDRYSALAEADSDFGKSITPDGNAIESATGDIGASMGSASHNNGTSGSTSGTTESTNGTSGGTFGSSRDTGSTRDSTTDPSNTFQSISGTSGAAGSTSNTTGDAFASASGTTEEERLLLHEERLNIGKERVQTGEVNVGKHVVEENQSIDVPVEREEVYVDRRPVNEEATGADAFQENDTIHVPVSEERVNVSKKEVVTEEIVITKRKVQDTAQVDETVRREVADIDEDTNNVNNKPENNKSGF